MRYFPLFMDLQDQPVLIVGGGVVAARKARLLLKAGAGVLVVTRAAGDDMAAWIEQGKVRLLAQSYDSE